MPQLCPQAQNPGSWTVLSILLLLMARRRSPERHSRHLEEGLVQKFPSVLPTQEGLPA